MPSKKLREFENLPPEALELLEAAGHTDVDSIFEHTYLDVSQELIKANRVLNILDQEPDNVLISEWLELIEQQAGKKLIRHGDSTPDNVEQPEARPALDQRLVVSTKDLQQSPVAIPLSEEFTSHNDLNVHELPQGIVHYSDSTAPSRQANQQQTISRHQPTVNPTLIESSSTLYGKNKAPERSAPPLDQSRILSMEEYQQEGSKVVVPETRKENNLTRTTRKETNKGVNPDSKFFIKGVLHQDIPKFKIGCYAFLFVNLLVFIAIAATPMAVIDKEDYWWAIFAPCLILPAIFIFFTSAQKASCPICTQKQFAIKRCLKHKNAHRWPIFGYMLPTCLHALFFKWFRCIFCGTSVRLKE